MPSITLRRKKASGGENGGGDDSVDEEGGAGEVGTPESGPSRTRSGSSLNQTRLASVFSRSTSNTGESNGGRRAQALRQTSSSSHLAVELNNEYRKTNGGPGGGSGILGIHRKRGFSNGDETPNSNRMSIFGFSRFRHNEEDAGGSSIAELESRPSSSPELAAAASGEGGEDSSLPTISLSQNNDNSSTNVTFNDPPFPTLSSPQTEEDCVEDPTKSPSGHAPQLSNASSSASLSDKGTSSGAFKAPLARLKKKTVSMLFSNDNSEPEITSTTPTHQSRPSESSSAGGDNSNNNTVFLGADLANTSPGSRPPLQRSLSSQSGARGGTGDDEDDGNSKLSRKNTESNRPRSRTLNSLSESPTTPGPNAAPSPTFTNKTSFSSLFGGKLRSESTESSARRHSPSPRPSMAVRETQEFQLLPDRLEEESESDFLARLKVLGYGSSTAALLAKHDDVFYRKALQIYVDSFDFKDEPLDMALRKFLMFAKLPRETQQIDRVLECFASTYHAVNPGVYLNSENAYIVVFALMILHTDFFNRNNKHKMQKSDFLRNTYAKGVPKDVLECFYDNITYTPFIHTDEDFVAPTRLPWSRRSSTFGRNGKDMLDPYTLIIECRLDVIRPSLGAVLNLEDPYDYRSPENLQQFKDLRQQFIDGPYLQLVSQRSRPEAFMTADTTADPEHSDPGIVDIKVVKIGILYRREARRMLYSKSTWKEWGAILTASQLYLFKDVSWIKTSILSQGNVSDSKSDISLSWVNKNQNGEGIIRVPIDGFHPSSVLSTFDMIALTNSKGESSSQSHSFLIVGRGGAQDWFAASSEDDMKDWMMKINFAASFNTYHVGIQGVVCEDRIVSRPHRMRSLRRKLEDEEKKQKETDNEEEDNKGDDDPKEDENPAPTPPLSSSSSSSSSISLTVANLEEASAEESRIYEELHTTRLQLVEQKLHEIEGKCDEKAEQLEEHIRSGNHLKILAPIQQRTREAVIFAAGRLTAKLDWHWLDNKRLLSYRDMFRLELGVERDLCEEARRANPEHNHHRFILTQPSKTSLPRRVSGDSNNAPDGGSSSFRTPSLKTTPSSTGSLYFDTDSITNQTPAAPAKDDTASERNSVHSIKTNASEKVLTLRDGDKKSFQKSLRDKSLRIKKRSSRSTDEGTEGEEVKRSPSLMRKEEGDFTLHGKKFSVVEVNPEFAHKRAASISTAGTTTNDDNEDD